MPKKKKQKKNLFFLLVYGGVLRTSEQYKTLIVSSDTETSDVIQMMLGKYGIPDQIITDYVLVEEEVKCSLRKKTTTITMINTQKSCTIQPNVASWTCSSPRCLPSSTGRIGISSLLSGRLPKSRILKPYVYFLVFAIIYAIFVLLEAKESLASALHRRIAEYGFQHQRESCVLACCQPCGRKIANRQGSQVQPRSDQMLFPVDANRTVWDHV